MNPKMMVPVIVLVLIMGAGSAMGLNQAAATTTSGQVGNYTFQYNASGSVVSNLQYTHESTTFNLTSQIQVSSDGAQSMNLQGPDGSVVLQNATILNTEAENTFLLMTSELGGNVSMLLNSNLTPTKVDLSTQMSQVSDFMSNHMNIKFSPDSFVYKTAVNGVPFYVFSNMKAARSGGYAYFSSLVSPVLVGIIPLVALLHNVEAGNLGNGSFHFNNTTGQLTGKYMSLNLNTTTGNVTDLQSTVFARTVFSNINVSATGTIGEGSDSVLLPAYQPILLKSIFLYSGNSYIYAFHDNPALQSVVVWQNGTVNFTLGSGINAKVIATQGQDTSVNTQMSTNASVFSNFTMEDNNNIEAGTSAVLLNGTYMRGFLFVNDGTVSLNGNSILVKSNGTGKVSFVVPPGLMGSKLNLSQRLYRAVQDGKVAAEIAITGNNASANITVHFNNSVRMVVSSVSSGNAAIKLSSSDHVGTNVLIFVSNSVISSTSNVKVTFDGVTVALNSVNGVLNTTSTTNATFAEMQTSGGILLLVHVPHFSNHTIVVSSSGQGSTTSSPTNFISQPGAKLLIVGALVVLVGITAAVIVRKRKN